MGIENAETTGPSARLVKMIATGSTPPRASAFAPIGFKFKYCLHSKLAQRARSLDRHVVCLNPVTNRKYKDCDKGVIRNQFRRSGSGLGARLPVRASTVVVVDSVEGLSAAIFSGRKNSRRSRIVAPHETQFVSGTCLKKAPSGRFAACGALSLSGVLGEREYHADF